MSFGIEPNETNNGVLVLKPHFGGTGFAPKFPLLKEHKDKTPTRVFPDELQYEEHYAAARRATYRTMPDGYQRGLSQLEEEALFLWRSRAIHLEGPPTFIIETHSLRERALLRQIHQDHMGYKLYVATPPQLKWPAATAKFHFCSSLVDKNQAGARSEVLELIDDVHLFTCSAESHLAVLRFVRPETRDKWVGRTFKFPFGSITLRATDTFEQDDKKAGLDEQAIAMLYPIHLLGRPEMPLMDVHAVAAELAGGLPILDIIPMEATGGRTLETHEWRIILHSLEAPPGIAKLRCLKITQGDLHFDLGVHQPRLAQRHPCSVCLGIGHYRNQCKHKGHKAKIAELRPPFERALTLPATPTYALELTAKTLEEHREQMTRVRESLAPDLAARDAATIAEAAAAVVKENEARAQQAAAARAEEAKVFAAAAAAVKAAEAEAAAKAKLLRKKQAKANKAKTPVGRFSAALQKPAKPTPVKPSAKPQREPAKPAPKPRRVQAVQLPEELRWVGRATQYEHTDGHVPGQKRKWDCDADQACADYFVDRARPAEAETNSEPPLRSLKTDGLRIVVRGRPDPRLITTNKLEQAVVTSFFNKAPVSLCGTGSPSADEEVEIVGGRPAPRPPVKLRALASSLGMSVVQTPANGSCLMHAIVGAQSRRCGAVIDDRDTVERNVALTLRRDLCSLLCKELRQLVDHKSLSIAGLTVLYLDGTVITAETTEADKFNMLIAHFAEVGACTDLDVGRRFWGGEAEIVAFVVWNKEAVYVLDVMETGDTFITRYVSVDVVQDDGSVVERVVQEFTSVQMFRAHVAVYKNQRVIPLVLICNHSWGNGQDCAHFTAARLPNNMYADWAGSDEKHKSMKKRYNRVVAVIDKLNLSVTPPTPPYPTQCGSPEISSEYVPSSTEEESSVASSAKAANAAADQQTPPSFELLPLSALTAENGPQTGLSVGTGSMDGAGNELAVHGPGDCEHGHTSTSLDGGQSVEHESDDGDTVMETPGQLVTGGASVASTELSLVLSSPPDPGLSYDSIERLMPASYVRTATMEQAEEADLLVALQKRKLTTKNALESMARADKAAANAYGVWIRRQAKESPRVHNIIGKALTVAAACKAAQHHPDVLRAILRSTPFPEVVVATLKDTVLLHAGRAAIAVARAQMLFRLQPFLPKAGAQFLRAWATSILTATDHATQWTLARDASKWQRLETLAAKAKLIIPPRTQPGLDDNLWAQLVAFLLAVPGSVPSYFQKAGFPMQCDALLLWAGKDANCQMFNEAATALQQRRWADILDLLHFWIAQGPRTSVAVAISHPGVSGAAAARS